jgi:hypothetical protein
MELNYKIKLKISHDIQIQEEEGSLSSQTLYGMIIKTYFTVMEHRDYSSLGTWECGKMGKNFVKGVKLATVCKVAPYLAEQDLVLGKVFLGKMGEVCYLIDRKYV